MNINETMVLLLANWCPIEYCLAEPNEKCISSTGCVLESCVHVARARVVFKDDILYSNCWQ